jgi:hypothetical protein
MWQALTDMNKSLGVDEMKTWMIMVEKLEVNIEVPNPFETIWKDQHVASVRAVKCLLGVYNSSTSLIKTQRAECELLD